MNKISTVIATITFSATMLAVSIVSIVIYFVLNQNLKEHIKKDRLEHLTATQKSIELLYNQINSHQFNELIHYQIYSSSNEIKAIRFVLKNKFNRFYYAKGTDQKNLDLENKLLKNDLSSMKAPLFFKNKNQGYVEVFYSNIENRSEKNHILLVIFFLLLILAYLIPRITIIYFKIKLSHPIEKLIAGANKIRSGDYSVQLQTTNFIELNSLTMAFNEMLLAIRNRDELLTEANEHLEDLIEIRTKERDEERLKSYNASRLASLGEMASAIAHEINNPLTIIKNYSKILQKHLIYENKTELAVKCSKIAENADRIYKIIRGLKNFTRDGQNDPRQSIEIEAFIEDLNALCASRIKDLDIDLIFEYDSKLIITINITQLGQVMINLINNSIDAIEKNDIKWIKVSFEQNETDLLIRVTDSGNGIKEDLIENLMVPFFTTKEFGKGTGLGLSLSHRIISEHGGNLVYNKKSAHTQFVVNLPQQVYI